MEPKQQPFFELRSYRGLTKPIDENKNETNMNLKRGVNIGKSSSGLEVTQLTGRSSLRVDKS